MARILAIDDEQSIVELIQETLTVCGYAVETAVNGRQGLQLFETHPFDLVVTDMCMPDIDGNRVLRYIRQSNRPCTPVVGISGTPWRLREANFNAVLTKPFSLMTLIDTVGGLLNDEMSFSQGNDAFPSTMRETACSPSP